MTPNKLRDELVNARPAEAESSYVRFMKTPARAGPSLHGGEDEVRSQLKYAINMNTVRRLCKLLCGLDGEIRCHGGQRSE